MLLQCSNIAVLTVIAVSYRSQGETKNRLKKKNRLLKKSKIEMRRRQGRTTQRNRRCLWACSFGYFYSYEHLVCTSRKRNAQAAAENCKFGFASLRGHTFLFAQKSMQKMLRLKGGMARFGTYCFYISSASHKRLFHTSKSPQTSHLSRGGFTYPHG